jgi:hypothetical protein
VCRQLHPALASGRAARVSLSVLCCCSFSYPQCLASFTLPRLPPQRLQRRM